MDNVASVSEKKGMSCDTVYFVIKKIGRDKIRKARGVATRNSTLEQQYPV